ncbi:DUF1045 domain-containing protein [Fulvimarina sp. MAC3]|uniref:DUF1045 domain-containing protein n=1 Tax=Fulvimarina sp. MAC3 TaxID=3148887 RepID=UPI0031FD125E
MRIAIYYTPTPDQPLAQAGASWLGRDAFSGALRQPGLPDEQIASARRYGFHATIRAPFRPIEGVSIDMADGRLADLCRTCPPAVITRLTLARLGSFLALVPDRPEPSLETLQRSVLEGFEPIRRPLEPDERARRRPERLSEVERRFLDEWGYPYVLDAFRFHLTLTDALDDAALDKAELLARSHFAQFIDRPLTIDRLALFVEPDAGAAFRVHGSHTLSKILQPIEDHA